MLTVQMRLLLTSVTATLALAAPAQAIVGGSAATIQQHPYQVAILASATTSSNYDAFFCGGSIRDATHIVTAGHCVYDSLRKGQAARPSQLQVLAGTSTLSRSPSGNASRLAVSQVSFNPAYDDTTYDDDSAVLTLQQPLSLAPGTSQDLITPATAADWAGVAIGDALTASGWGALHENDPALPTELQHVDVPLVSDSTCAAHYAPEGIPIDGSLMICAGDLANGGVDSCQGDSGGALVRAFGPATPDDYELVGIVSNGIGCAEADFPGIYTEASAPSVRDYITQSSPVDAPTAQVLPSLSGTPAVGSTLHCATGTWTPSAPKPPELTVQWVRTSGGADTALTGIGAPPDYSVQRADAGSTISCIVRARNDGGRAIVRSAPSETVPTPPPDAQPQPVVPGTPAPPPTAPVQQDTNSPVARVLSGRCVKTTCTLKVSVVDAGFSAGVAKVTGSVRSTYRRDGRTRHRTRRFTARRTAATRFTVRLTKLPVGTQAFALVATDKAGHRQLIATRRTLRTRR